MTNNTRLGRLESVDPRVAWASEAGDFTPWLAGEENLALLGDTIGLELELDSTERNVGPFRADILCKDTVTGNWVLIENQLERTDHSHLGQLLTYAAGLNAVTIVWIARHFTEEHRAALDWLNDITGENLNFFGLEVELWRIGDSAVAPKFNMASKPNDWIKSGGSVGGTGRSGTLSEIQQTLLSYWQGFMDYVQERGVGIRPRRAYPDTYADFAIGRTDFTLSAMMQRQKKYLRVSLYLTGLNAKPQFYVLREQASDIEQEIGTPLKWHEQTGKKRSYVSTDWEGVDPEDKADWPRQFEWLLDRLETFHKCFAPRVKTLDAADYIAESNEDEP